MYTSVFNQRQQQCVDKRIPPEIWEKIFERLYPSQLSRLSRASRTLHAMIGSLPLWKRIFESTHSNKEPLRLLRGRANFKSHMVYISVLSRHICEVCFKLSKFQELHRAHLPLPVMEKLNTISAVTGVQHVGEMINWDWAVRKCRLCRDKNSSSRREDHSAPWTRTETKTAQFFPKSSNYFRAYTVNEWISEFPPFKEIPEAMNIRGHLAETTALTLIFQYFGGELGAKAAKESTMVDDNITWDRMIWYQTQD